MEKENLDLQVNKIQAIVSDYDGTIAKSGMMEPSEELFVLLEKLLDKGIRFVSASGRQYQNLRDRFAPVADRIDYICENGSLIAYQNEIVYKDVIERKTALELIRDMEQYEDGEIMVSGLGTSYIVPKTQYFIDRLVKRVRNHVTILKAFEEIEADIIKISIFWQEGIPPKAAGHFHEKYDACLQVADGGNGWLDFTGKTSGKGNALKILAKHMDIPLENMISFGDNENDMDMLKETGYSYCMSSAKDHVKLCAGHVCDSVEEVLSACLEQLETFYR